MADGTAAGLVSAQVLARETERMRAESDARRWVGLIVFVLGQLFRDVCGKWEQFECLRRCSKPATCEQPGTGSRAVPALVTLMRQGMSDVS